MDKEQFSHGPLQPGQIRLLRLRSSYDLHFDLVSVYLQSKPKFAALSYTWGDQQLSRQILVNGRKFFIRENLFLAFKQFQRGISSREVKYPLKSLFWVDAICVDQSENAIEERNTQVRMMASIYLSAEEIFVWLGPPEDETRNHNAGVLMRNLEERCRAGTASSLGTKPWFWPKKPMNAFDSAIRLWRVIAQREINTWSTPGSGTQDAWRGVVDMWRSPWWTRAWAHQEATIPEPGYPSHLKARTPKAPKAKVSFVCGDVYTTWFEMIAALQAADPILASKIPSTEMLRGSGMYMNRVFIIRQWRNSDEPVEFLDVLNSFRLASCRDARDKVYAALGVSKDRNQMRITPNYHLSVAKVYMGVVELLLAANRTPLDFLGYACDMSDEAKRALYDGQDWAWVPSWVPNWQHKINITPLPKTLYIQGPPSTRRKAEFVDRRHTRFANTIDQTPAYNACGRFCTQDATIYDWHLRTSGVYIDTIDEVTLNEGEARFATMLSWRERVSNSRYPDGTDFDRAWGKTHCADVKFQGIPVRTPVSRGYEIDDDLLERRAEELAEGEMASQANMRMSLQAMTRWRCVCFTKGERLALVPYSSQPGDKICMFFGGQVLYVLRPNAGSGRTHKYIGEAYLHGMMDGEVNDLVESWCFPIEQFVLE